MAAMRRGDKAETTSKAMKNAVDFCFGVFMNLYWVFWR